MMVKYTLIYSDLVGIAKFAKSYVYRSCVDNTVKEASDDNQIWTPISQ